MAVRIGTVLFCLCTYTQGTWVEGVSYPQEGRHLEEEGVSVRT